LPCLSGAAGSKRQSPTRPSGQARHGAAGTEATTGAATEDVTEKQVVAISFLLVVVLGIVFLAVDELVIYAFLRWIDRDKE
jgi:hypothetical protein